MERKNIIFSVFFSPPDGCLQWYREPTGRITSFNNAQSKTLLPNTNYRSCIRQEAGSCCIEYQVNFIALYTDFLRNSKIKFERKLLNICDSRNYDMLLKFKDSINKMI